MGTKTIGLREEVYERLKAQKRDDESFSDLVDRLVDERRTDWREGFGTLPDKAAEEIEAAAEASRDGGGGALSRRSDEAIEGLSKADDEASENEQ